MSTLSNWLKLLVGRQVLRRSQTVNGVSSHIRTLSDTPDVNTKTVMVHGTENDERLRVRRARPADVPRVLHFVREHARTAWPGLAAPSAAPQMMLCDYVARALAQGHSMVAEQQEARRGWTQIRGIALSVAVCPWDASMLEKWARCVRCTPSRRLLAFTAHCLRAPALHDKYRVHNILQVILIVPQHNSRSSEIINILAKNAIKRGREVGFPLIRFDVTSEQTAKIMDNLHFKKEWQLSYDILPEAIRESEAPRASNPTESFTDDKKEKSKENIKTTYKHHVAVYTAFVADK